MRYICSVVVCACFLSVFCLADPVPVGSPIGTVIGTSPSWIGGDDYIYLGTYAGNDNITLITKVLTDNAYPITGVNVLGKSDGSFPGFTCDGCNNSTFGTWTYDGRDGQIAFMVLKASSQWALYALKDPFVADKLYKWNTADLINGGGNQPEISHLTGVTGSSTVPETSPFILIGIGVLFLGFLRFGIRFQNARIINL